MVKGIRISVADSMDVFKRIPAYLELFWSTTNVPSAERCDCDGNDDAWHYKSNVLKHIEHLHGVHHSERTSEPARVPIARQIGREIFWLTKRVAPSARTTLTPPVCQLLADTAASESDDFE